ncbi:MAG: UDP-N-acetylmuramate-L-alanine ligase [Candidatus Gottesmanbacteria bacterium GW2011_GWC2_39_8]|uniref:UDP-N-acetylmuramate--L-alanine ligase n=1 Tax=Candidatus Gottesmanbacteria bacterium GW2011_GWC2_39_8 TaxID=1618450 RepID=A0A0G0T983_9BACT|nr:MAG: UDP-N-acetylmuramate-L-alanine ligase [Candidatus Gottesmanbacteria bacterium GW2011_GWC2_39_8]
MKIKSAYFIGIKGVAMTALAVVLKERGVKVSGSDVTDIFQTDEVLEKNKIEVLKGFSTENVPKKTDLVVVTGAHGGMTNIEAKTAESYGFPVFMHGKALGMFMNEKDGISVAGSHGKTTTSAMTAFILSKAKLDPSFAVGSAEIIGLGAGGHNGRGKIFVAEADEYVTCPKTDSTPRFYFQKPKIFVITNIDFDHPDVYPDVEAVKMIFVRYIENLSAESIIIAGIDNPSVQSVVKNLDRNVITYGFSPQADFRIYKVSSSNGTTFFNVIGRGIDLGEFMIRVPGKHNALNALASGIAANNVGVGWEMIKYNLKKFSGTKRRFEKIADIDGISLYDDYAHHPTEIQTTLKGIREWFPEKKIYLLFQPHTYTRTKALFSDFAKSFSAVDTAIITDIYPSARETPDLSVDPKKLVLEINKFKNNSIHLKGKETITEFLKENVKKGDIILTMGAGDICNWHSDIIQSLKKW